MTSVLLEKGAEVNKPNNAGVTPLILAAQNGHTAVTSALLEKGAEVNKPNNAGLTPLTIAAHNGHTLVVQRLLEGGANKAMKSSGKTALEWARSKNHAAVVKLLE